MTPKENITKIMKSCELALSNLEKGNKLSAQGDVNFIRSFAEAAYWLLDSEIKKEDEY